MRSRIISCLGGLVVAILLAFGAAAPAQAGIWGTLRNDTDWAFLSAGLYEGSDSCRVWNTGGGNVVNVQTIRCALTYVAPRTTTGFWHDVDAFTVGGLNRTYSVCFPTGPCRTIPWDTFTEINDNEIATCRGEYVVCTVTWK